MQTWIGRAAAVVGALAVAHGAAAAPRALTLGDAVALARAQAPAVQVAQARIGEAEGRQIGAAVALADNPVLRVGGGPRIGADGVQADLDVSVRQVFELGGQRAHQHSRLHGDTPAAASSATPARAARS